tara:strand:+ start:113 stop:682 length:570 start_codon:yes stop_codon:yes gene_type:complete
MINNSKIVRLKGVGEILLQQSNIAKHIRISFKPPSNIRVAVPNGVTFSEAQKFAEMKSKWIQKQIQKFSGAKIVSLYNKSSELSLKEIEIKSDIIIKRVIDLAKNHGFKHGNISVKKMKTRWGSCSYKNNININLCICYLPQDLQDYIILHELAHTVVKNHSRHFWYELHKISSDIDTMRHRLRNNYFL